MAVIRMARKYFLRLIISFLSELGIRNALTMDYGGKEHRLGKEHRPGKEQRLADRTDFVDFDLVEVNFFGLIQLKAGRRRRPLQNIGLDIMRTDHD